MSAHAIIASYLADHSVRHSQEVLGLHYSAISRACTEATEGRLSHGQKWTAEQYQAMIADDERTLGAVIAAVTPGRSGDAEILPTVSALLATAQRATDAVSAASPGGTRLTEIERRDLAATYLQTIARLATAVHALRHRVGS